LAKRATEGTDVRVLVKLAVPVFKEAEQQCPRTGPGAKPAIPDWVMAALIMIVVLKKRKSKSSQYRHLRQHRKEIADWLGNDAFPSRATYFRRYTSAHRFYQKAIGVQGRLAIEEGIVDPQQVAVDKSLLEAQGPPWHKRDRERDREANKHRSGVDEEATWGYSEHHGWIYGYSYEVAVSCKRDSVVFPLLASVDVASMSECRTFADKISELPTQTIFVAADSGYDSNALAEQVEYDEHGKRTGRRYLCPENPRNKRKKTKPCKADASRAQSRERRRERREFLKTAKGQRLYQRRKTTVEPFNQWFKSLFELDAGVWHRGLDNNRTQMMAALFAYQLLVRYNHQQGRRNGRIRHLLDAL